MRQLIFIYVSMLFMASTCGGSVNQEVNPGFYSEGFTLPYQVNNPILTMKMDRALTEVSGLAYSTKLEILYAINDEKGYIYGINPESGAIIDKIDFAKSDDYEGITYVNETIYVAESNGNIKVVSEQMSEKINEYDDKLSRDNDIEGIAYNPISETILLAAKGDSKEDGNDKDYKSLFQMNVLGGHIYKEPFLSIDAMAELKKLKKRDITQNAIVNLSITKRVSDFAPSGVAVHPISNDIYILSARGKLLVVSDQKGEVKAIVFLDQSRHVQPEGICFAPDGTLYISNEGRSRSGLIYKYNMIK